MQIQTSKEGGVIVYSQDDFLGLCPGYGEANYPKLGRGSSWQKAINTFLNGPGVLCPGLVGTALENASAQISAKINSACVERTSSVPRAWLIEAGTKIHQIALNFPYDISTTSPFPYTIVAEGAHSAHTTQVGEDIITFNIGGTEYVFFSYNDSADGDVGRSSIDGSSIDDDWFSTSGGLAAVLNKNVPHPMIVGDNQKLYIADMTLSGAGTLAKLWEVEPSAGAVTYYTAIIPRNYVIRSFAKTGDYLVIFANKFKGSSGNIADYGDSVAYFWDYSSSTQALYRYNLNDNEVTAGFNYNGTIGCFTEGRLNEFVNVGYTSKLQIFEGGKFTPKFNFDETAPNHGGVDIVNNMLIWNSQGTIYSYGSPYAELPARVNKINQGASTSNGFIKALNGTEIYASSGSGANNEVFKQAETYYASSDWRGLTAEPLFPAHTQGVVEYVEVGFYKTASGGRTATLKLDFDYEGATTASVVLDAVSTITAGKQILYRSHDSAGASFPPFSAVKPIVTFAAGGGVGSTPKINYIKIYYKLKAITF